MKALGEAEELLDDDDAELPELEAVLTLEPAELATEPDLKTTTVRC